jgi:hypothetical protein
MGGNQRQGESGEGRPRKSAKWRGSNQGEAWKAALSPLSDLLATGVFCTTLRRYRIIDD